MARAVSLRKPKAKVEASADPEPPEFKKILNDLKLGLCQLHTRYQRQYEELELDTAASTAVESTISPLVERIKERCRTEIISKEEAADTIRNLKIKHEMEHKNKELKKIYKALMEEQIKILKDFKILHNYYRYLVEQNNNALTN